MTLTRTIPGVYEHVQTAPSNTWVIQHWLGSYPAVDIYIDYAGEKHRVLPLEVQYNSVNSCTILFTSAYSGLATVS